MQTSESRLKKNFYKCIISIFFPLSQVYFKAKSKYSPALLKYR